MLPQRLPAATKLMNTGSTPAPVPDELAARVRAFLQDFACRSQPITYQQLANSLQLAPPNTIHRLTNSLEALMQQDATARRPFITALVISKRRNGLPAPGFFDCAAALGRFEGDAVGADAAAFHSQEFAAAVAYWSGKRLHHLDSGAPGSSQ